MHNGKTISIGFIIWKVLNNKLITDLTIDDAATYVLEALPLIGAPLVYSNTVDEINIKEYKAALPNNLVEIRGIKFLQDYNQEYNNTVFPTGDVALRYATDIYHNEKNCDDDSCKDIEFTYEIQNGIITTSIREGKLAISYKHIEVDEEGYPLIPDNEKVKLALEYYITHRYLEGLWALGKITDKVFNYYEQKRHFYMGAANSSMQMPSVDQMESIMNGITRIIYKDYAHQDFFKKYGEKERIKRYN